MVLGRRGPFSGLSAISIIDHSGTDKVETTETRLSERFLKVTNSIAGRELSETALSNGDRASDPERRRTR